MTVGAPNFALFDLPFDRVPGPTETHHARDVLDLLPDVVELEYPDVVTSAIDAGMFKEILANQLPQLRSDPASSGVDLFVVAFLVGLVPQLEALTAARLQAVLGPCSPAEVSGRL